MLRWWLLCVGVGATACYRPATDGACTVSCEFAANPTCPSGLMCGTDNLCYAGTQCDQLTGLDAPMIDAPAVDAPILLDGSACYGTDLVVYCPTVIPSTYEVPPAPTTVVDTSDPATDCTEVIKANGVEVCVIAAEVVAIRGTLRAVGRRPLLLFGRQGIVVNGAIDVSAAGAGITTTSCFSPQGANQQASGGSAGGGAGGSFGGSGGQGGSANDSLHAMAELPGLPVAVRGGCGGGRGGNGFQSASGGPGGLAGGAVYLLSAGTIEVVGTIDASGTGGTGGQSAIGASSGGGGGGSGGLIGLEAPQVVLRTTAVLLAQGGGGGGGSTGSVSAQNGGTPTRGFPAASAPGGAKTGVNSGDGGAGSGGTATDGVAGADATGGSGSGGGGGGGAGVIRYYDATLTDNGASVYPPVP